MTLTAQARRLAEKHLPESALNVVMTVAHLRPTHRRFLVAREQTAARRAAIDDQVIAELGGSFRVQSGPFKGMTLLRQKAWGFDYSARLLGTYELELSQVVETVAASKPSNIIDVGCADGWYTTGLARLCPQARVVGFDISENARAHTVAMAAANQVSDRVAVRAKCKPQDLTELPEGTIVIVDIEGAELDLVTEEVIASSPHATWIIECHDMYIPDASKIMNERFAGREMTLLRELPRTPDMAPNLEAGLAALAMDEQRSGEGLWLVVQPV